MIKVTQVHPTLALLILASLFLCASNAFATSPLDSVKVFSMKLGYVVDSRLPKYVRIDAELYSDAKTDLSGSWSTKYDQGWLDLKPNGLATITTYLYGDGLADTIAKTLDLLWTSPDTSMSGTIHLPFDWSRVVRRESTYSGEWFCSGMQASSVSGTPYTTVFIPVPCKVMVIAMNTIISRSTRYSRRTTSAARSKFLGRQRNRNQGHTSLWLSSTVSNSRSRSSLGRRTQRDIITGSEGNGKRILDNG